MSRTKRKEKPVGFDYWSRRCFGNSGLSYGKIAKEITKKKERSRNRKMIHDVLKDHEHYEKRFAGE